MNTINDDRILDARDMQAEVTEARGGCSNCGTPINEGLRCANCRRESLHAQMQAIPIPQAEINEARNPAPRTFADVINEWTNACLRENKTATLDGVILITRLGTLGQRLIYEAASVGMNEVARTVGDTGRAS